MGAAVIFPDRSLWTGGSGHPTLAGEDVVTGDTPFVIGSITKTFVTAAVMQLADEGRLSLEDPLANWLPDYPNAGAITVRQLLGHRSGIHNYFEHPQYDARVFGSMRGHRWTPDEILEEFARPPYFEPGTGYHYSNTGFILLGLIVEAVTGKPMDGVLEERFFTPLGLEDTYFQDDEPASPETAQGHLLRLSGFKEISDESGYRPTISAATVAWAAGSMAASARDAAVWGDALYGGHVVSPQALAEMEGVTFYPQTGETYGLGTRSRQFGGERMFGHTGSIRGYVAAMWHFKDSGLTIVALSNRGRIDANSAIDAIAEVAHPAAQEAEAAARVSRGSTLSTAITAASEATDEGPRLKEILDRQRVSLGIPGASASVIFPDGSIWRAGSGRAQLSPDANATGKTPFVSGSITKTFVAAAVMQLAEESRLSIDAPLASWLPNYPRADQITLRHLLSHTSGVFNYFDHPTFAQRVYKTDADHLWTAQEIIDEFDGPPYFAPGEGFHYSNTGYILLGLVIEQVTGQPLGQVFRERFYSPIGLARTYFQGEGPPPASSAHGYLYNSGAWREWSDETSYRPTISAGTVAWAAGGMVSSAPNVARWCAALYGGDILSDASLLEMTGTDYSNYTNGGYGLGTRMRFFNGKPAVGHTGSLRGFNATMWYFPESALTVVVTTNLGRVNLNGLVDALATEALN